MKKDKSTRSKAINRIILAFGEEKIINKTIGKGKKLMKAAWFSRHQPTAEQLAEIGEQGYEISHTDIEAGIQLGARALNNEEEVREVLEALLATGADAIFGVFPTPIMARFSAVAMGIPCFAAWNVCRSVVGGRPTFEHKKWMVIGAID